LLADELAQLREAVVALVKGGVILLKRAEPTAANDAQPSSLRVACTAVLSIA